MLNFIKRHWPTALAALILLTALTGVYAKYVMEQPITGTASITAKLGSVQVLESKAVPNALGEYTLNTALAVTENTYNIVIPGLDIPKDPYVVIQNKTEVPVYIFVEVVNKLSGSEITFTIDDDCWLELTGFKGEHGGTVYVYTTNKTSAAAAVADPSPINILDGKQVTVGQELLHGLTENLALSFYASLIDTSIADAATAYKNVFPTTPSP